MPKIINMQLVNFHDIVLIASIAIIAHYTMLPIYKMVSNSPQKNPTN